jgi:HEAT repeat protein
MISDPDRETRTRAISTLYDLAGKNNLQKSLADAVGSALSRSSGDTRLDLIYAAGHGGQPSLSTSLTPYLRDDSAPVRKATANALAELSAKDSAAGIAAAAQAEKDEEVQVALARAVQKIGVLDAGGALIGWLESGFSGTAKEAARSALASLAGENFGSDIGRWKAWWEKAHPQ